jgi:CPA2 family monovalent cation:H+ antiporter-2
VQERAGALVGPLRDLFAATFFVFFSFQIDPSSLVGVLLPATALTIVTAVGKVATGWVAARSIGVGSRGAVRAGTALVARGEFSIVIASLGVGREHGGKLTALAAAYVLLTAIVGPLMAKYADYVRPEP